MGEDGRSHGVVEHGGQETALDEAGGVAKLLTRLKTHADPANSWSNVNHMPTQKDCARGCGQVVEKGCDGHSRSPLREGLPDLC